MAKEGKSMSGYRERVAAKLRVEFLNALTNGDFEIIHKVNVHEKLAEGGCIDYKDESEEVNIKAAALKQAKDGKGGFKYVLKITVE